MSVQNGSSGWSKLLIPHEDVGGPASFTRNYDYRGPTNSFLGMDVTVSVTEERPARDGPRE